KERAKELNCLYQVEELIHRSAASLDEILGDLINIIPKGWQYPDNCAVRITFGESIYQPHNFVETPWFQKTDIIAQDDVVGTLSVFYTKEMPKADEGPFFKEERKLLETIAMRLGHCAFHRKLKAVFQNWDFTRSKEGRWEVILDLLRNTDPQLLMRVSRKMSNYLYWSGSKQAEQLLDYFSPAYKNEESQLLDDLNQPLQKKVLEDFSRISEDVFKIAVDYFGEQTTLFSIQKWIKEDKSNYLANILENPGSVIPDIAEAIGRFHHMDPKCMDLSQPRERGFRVSLIRRLLTDQPQFINVAKQYLDIHDFHDLLQHIIFSGESHGKLGGKSSGLFLAHQILKKVTENSELCKNIKIPKTWYITSDVLLRFIHYNNLDDIFEQKYKNIGQVQREYPYIVYSFKNSTFPNEIIKGLSMVLDEFEDRPLIVRSSSLLEDRVGTSFAGMYKSLFLANQGSKKERLIALMDAIAEVYASIFSPDPIEYRAERGLLDFHEEMAIMIQEVVGSKVGTYFLPSFAGVAFSHNEIRWSPRIKREDGLVRLVPGLGTRAVDRLSEDFPILIAPGQSTLRVNVTIDEIVRYSPKNIDVINLKTKKFETIKIIDLLKEYGYEYPLLNQIFSILKDDHVQSRLGLDFDFEKDDLIPTFEGLIKQTPFIKQMHILLETLKDKLGLPVDIEFASDGKFFYLLQCRAQSYSADYQPSPIPNDISEEKIIFTANRFVSNGSISNITHIVYIDALKYFELSSRSDLIAVGRLVGNLNQILPKRQFILIGPGRWGSRGDIRLGVNVSYSDINNTAVLIEVAHQKENYIPELSFGTHFFQDLIEASIRYLPLYPDNPDVIFNIEFLAQSENILSDILPEYAFLSDTVRIIDVTKVTNGQVLQILMNADLDRAVGYLTASPLKTLEVDRKQPVISLKKYPENHWWWRLQIAEKIASLINPEHWGVKGIYLFGSTKNATAGPESDIDLLIHFQGNEAQKQDLTMWLNGWSLCLDEMNFLQTGHKKGGLLDLHFVTDEDIANRTSYAIKIGGVTDAARPLHMR
ncbi:MAG: pyruvate, phosphate dikinase, partial [Candidatus Schekmanbacteria bacterium RBG_13_48_7]